MKEKLIIHTTNEAFSFNPNEVVCVEADGNYCNLLLLNGNKYLLSYQLGHIESMMKEQFSYSNYSFVRVGKSLIVNIDELVGVNITKQTLEMSQQSGEKVMLSASREALKKLMNFLIETKNNSIIRNINMKPICIKKAKVLRGHIQHAIQNDDIRIICND